MKPVSLKTLVLTALFSASLLAQVSTLSQSTNGTTITALNSIACSSGSTAVPPITTIDNGYLRSYPLASVGGPIDIVSIRFAVENLTTPGPYPMIIKLFNDPNGGLPSPYSSLVLRKTENFTLAAATATIFTVPITGSRATFLNSETLVVEVNSPAGIVGSRFYMGSNTLGQSAAGYLRAPACGFTDPTSLAAGTINAPNMHIILDVNYVPAGTGVPFPGTNEDVAMYTGVNAATLSSGYGNYLKLASGGNTVQVKVVSNLGGFNNRELALIAQGFPTSSPPFPPAAPGIWLSFPGLIFLIGGDSTSIGPIDLPPGGTTVSFTVPFGLAGTSVMFQGAVVTHTPPFALNGLYASTHGHVFQF